MFLFVVCVIYTYFSFDKCLEWVLDLLEWRLKLLKPKGESLECSRVVKVFTSPPPSLLSRLVKAARVVNRAFCHESWTMHESSTLLSVMSREPFTSRQQAKDFKSHKFSDLSSFLVLRITLSTNVRIEWFKLLWKDNSEYYKFYEDTFLRKMSYEWTKIPLNLLHMLEWWLLEMEWCLSELLSIIKAFPAFSKRETFWRNIN